MFATRQLAQRLQNLRRLLIAQFRSRRESELEGFDDPMVNQFFLLMEVERMILEVVTVEYVEDEVDDVTRGGHRERVKDFSVEELACCWLSPLRLKVAQVVHRDDSTGGLNFIDKLLTQRPAAVNRVRTFCGDDLERVGELLVFNDFAFFVKFASFRVDERFAEGKSW